MFGQVNLGEVVFISVYRVSIFLVQIRLVMEIMGVKSRAAQCSPVQGVRRINSRHVGDDQISVRGGNAERAYVHR